MDIVIDTSSLLAVIVAEPERDRIVELTTGHSLIGPRFNSLKEIGKPSRRC